MGQKSPRSSSGGIVSSFGPSYCITNSQLQTFFWQKVLSLCSREKPNPLFCTEKLSLSSEILSTKISVGTLFLNFCLGTAYDISSMESVGNSKSFSLVGKVCLSKCFYLSIFALSSGTSTNPYFPLRRAFILLYEIFIVNLGLHLFL